MKDRSKAYYTAKTHINIKELIYKCQEEKYRKIRSDLSLILEGQEMNQKDLRLGFIKLAAQNIELLESNKKLNHPLETVVKELYELKYSDK